MPPFSFFGSKTASYTCIIIAYENYLSKKKYKPAPPGTGKKSNDFTVFHIIFVYGQKKTSERY